MTNHRAAWGWVLLASLSLLAACGDDDVMIGDDDAGGGDDAGPGPDRDGGPILDIDSGPGPDIDAGPGGEPCGPTTCGAGMVCCNPSCGICTPPGGSCIELACVDAGPGGEPCGPVTCGAGMVCCNASCGICTAPGEGCIAIACEDAGPPGRVCGGFAGLPCDPGEFCAYPPDAFCGAADGTGICTRPPAICPDIHDPVCGCDGSDYGNECEANRAGTSVASRGTCGGGGDCDAQIARGVGACDAFFGYYWDGRSCYGVSGCSCEGIHCGTGWGSREECMMAHSTCPGGGGGCSCAADQYCDWADDSCGSSGAAPTCLPRPGSCSTVYDPVCGCDGTTHSNACAAASAGVDVAYVGECRAMSDCRTTGCAMGESCQLCWFSYACIPDGAIC